MSGAHARSLTRRADDRGRTYAARFALMRVSWIPGSPLRGAPE